MEYTELVQEMETFLLTNDYIVLIFEYVVLLKPRGKTVFVFGLVTPRYAPWGTKNNKNSELFQFFDHRFL